MNAGTKDAKHFAAVDGLRGLACLAVVAHHCFVHCGEYQWPLVSVANQTVALSRVFFYFKGGVELFFIVSGFCLAYPFCSRLAEEPWQRWFMRRAYRILPPYYASVLLLCGMYVLLRVHPFSLFGMSSPPTGPISLKSLFVCVTLLNTSSINASYWTLVLESRWYLVFPLLIGVWRRAGSTVLVSSCVIAAAAGVGLVSVFPHFSLIAGHLPAFLPIFASGMVIARWCANGNTPRWLVKICPYGLLASIVLVAAVIPSDGSAGQFATIVPLWCVAFFILLSALHSRPLSRLFHSRALVGVGAFSYSLYLIHEPVVRVAYSMLRQLELRPSVQFLVYQGVLLPACVGLGYIFYRAVERPLLRRSRLVFKPVPAAAAFTSQSSNASERVRS